MTFTFTKDKYNNCHKASAINSQIDQIIKIMTDSIKERQPIESIILDATIWHDQTRVARLCVYTSNSNFYCLISPRLEFAFSYNLTEMLTNVINYIRQEFSLTTQQNVFILAHDLSQGDGRLAPIFSSIKAI